MDNEQNEIKEALKNYGNSPAFACVDETFHQEGICLRDYMATKIMSAMLVNSTDLGGYGLKMMAQMSVVAANELIKELNNPQ